MRLDFVRIILLKFQQKRFFIGNFCENENRIKFFISVNCWPNENDGECEVTIEYELQLKDLELNDVTIYIPVP